MSSTAVGSNSTVLEDLGSSQGDIPHRPFSLGGGKKKAYMTVSLFYFSFVNCKQPAVNTTAHGNFEILQFMITRYHNQFNPAFVYLRRYIAPSTLR